MLVNKTKFKFKKSKKNLEKNTLIKNLKNNLINFL